MFLRPRPTNPQRIVLVVDGDRTFRHFAMRAARSLGCSAIGLRDAEEALHWLDVHAPTEAPSLVSVDAKLRALSGYALCQRIRAMPGVKHVPIVFASSRVELEDNILALEAGADEFLPKPVQSQLYVDTLDRYLTMGRPREITVEVSLDIHVDVVA